MRSSKAANRFGIMANAIGFGEMRSAVGVTGDRFEGRAIAFIAIGVGEGRSHDID
jgi:hypothetical protein